MTRTLLALLFLAAAPLAQAAIPELSTPIAEATVSADHRAAWDAELRVRRANGIAHLRNYAANGVFPQAPEGVVGLYHQFLDVNGNPCAVASMIIALGRMDLVQATAATRNDVVLSDLTDGPLVEWTLTSGFTREEIAIIQEPGWNGGLDFEPIDDLTLATAEQARIRAHLAATLALLETDTEKAIRKALGRLDLRKAPSPS